MTSFRLSSDAFSDDGEIPARYTCDGDNVSSPLRWAAPPEGTQSLALVMDDPDAPSGTFTHWLAWGLDPRPGGLGEGTSAPMEGVNDFGDRGYAGPCPPPGHGRHRYRFRLHALSADPRPGASDRREEFERAIDGLVRATAELVGGYER